MTYQGSKEKIADELATILSSMRRGNQLYWEPFVGSASVFSRMAEPRLGTDIMTDLIMLWNEVIRDTFAEPSYLSKEQYDELMQSDTPSALRAYAGFFWSFSCMFRKGYSPDTFANSRSFYSMQQRAKLLRGNGTKLAACAYDKPVINNALIYCDPPYRGTTSYRGTPEFDHDQFYSWCVDQVARGNQVFVSEYEMPEPFKLIHEFHFRTTLSTVYRDQAKPERLYTL